MDTNEPTGAPELSDGHEPKTPRAVGPATPQLVRSTPSTLPPELGMAPDEADAYDYDESALSDEPDALNEHVEEPGDPDGVVAAEEERKWREEHPLPPEAAYTSKRLWPKILLALIIIAAATAGAYWYGVKKADQHKPQATSNAPATQHQTQPASVPTKHYDSSIYTLGFDYPQAWTISDTTTRLTVTSPAEELKGTSGAQADTHIVVTFQNPQTSIPGYPANGAVAALASDKLTYKQPTSIQRAQTYLSYLSYHAANGLDALYITGDNGYQQGQQVPMSDVTKGNPLISVTFETCTSSDCSTGTPTPVTLLATDWQSSAVSKDVTNLLQSLTLN